MGWFGFIVRLRGCNYGTFIRQHDGVIQEKILLRFRKVLAIERSKQGFDTAEQMIFYACRGLVHLPIGNDLNRYPIAFFGNQLL